uniref:Uncharacterized protein n=1 Tax=Arundo donax TaxID=35708 RepID=A0A0A8ZVF4_ARUDO
MRLDLAVNLFFSQDSVKQFLSNLSN